jgi:hypothetical protein
MLRLVQTVHLSYTDNNIVSKWTDTIFHMTHITYVRLAQTVHLSCVKISTISKWTELTFHLSLIT